MRIQIPSPATQTAAAPSAGFAGAGDVRQRVVRAMPALRRASGFAIFAGGMLVLAAHAMLRLHGG